jgi:hypothetical protein
MHWSVNAMFAAHDYGAGYYSTRSAAQSLDNTH